MMYIDIYKMESVWTIAGALKVISPQVSMRGLCWAGGCEAGAEFATDPQVISEKKELLWPQFRYSMKVISLYPEIKGQPVLRSSA